MKSSSKILLGIFVLLLLLAGTTWKFILPGLAKTPETQIAAFIESLPGDLKAGSITVDAIKRSVVISDLKGTLLYKGQSIALSVDSISGDGMALDAGRAPGQAGLLDKLSVTGFSAACDGASRSLKADSLSLEDIRADISGYTNRADEQAALKTLLDSLYIKLLDAKNLSGSGVSDSPQAFGLASLTLDNVNTKTDAKLLAKGLSLTFSDDSKASVESLRSDAVRPIALLTAVVQFASGGKGADLYAALTGDKAPLKTLALDKFALTVGSYGLNYDSLTADFAARSIAWLGYRDTLSMSDINWANRAPNGNLGDIALNFSNLESVLFTVGSMTMNEYSGDMTQKMDSSHETHQEITTKAISGKGFRMDASDVLRRMKAWEQDKKATQAAKAPQANATSGAAATPETDPMDTQKSLVHLLGLASTMHMDQVVVSGYTNKLTTTPDDNMSGTSAIKRGEYNDISLLSYGPMKIDGLTTSIGGVVAISMDSFSSQSIKIPDVLVLLAGLSDDEPTKEDFLKLLEKQPITISGMTLGNCAVTIMGMTLKAEKMAFDLEFGASRFLWRQALNKLVIPPEIYASTGQQGRNFQKVYQKPLVLDGAADVEIQLADGKGSIELRDISLSDPGLGNFSMTASLPVTELRGDILDILDGDGKEFLREATLRVEDKNVVETFMKIQYEQMKATNKLAPDSTTATLRQSSVNMLKGLLNEEKFSPDMKKIADGVIQLVSAPGTLRVTLKPAKPLPLEQTINNPEKSELGATVEYTPAK